MNLLSEVRKYFEPALAALAPDSVVLSKCLGTISATKNATHGDYEAKFAPQLAAALKKPNSEAMALAKQVLAALPANPMIAALTTAGPGFINIKLDDNWIAARVREIASDPRLGVAITSTPKRFVIDYSGPNVAKPLHVGHLRSTIIGDALLRILRFLGHTVIGDNHLGDWGTQFGILIYGYRNHLDRDAFEKDPVRELARLYVLVRNLAKAADTDDEETATGSIMDACRLETAKLHAGDPENLALWKQFMPHCLEMLKPIYERLQVHITTAFGMNFEELPPADKGSEVLSTKSEVALGESFYNPLLAGVVESLIAKGIAVESNGALVVPNAKGLVPTAEELSKEEPPALIRKRDGAFTYTTTDLATIQFRIQTWKPDVMLYVVDARQALHFKTLFANARRWLEIDAEMQHLPFGSVLDADGKPFGARKGGAPELGTLLDEAAARGLAKFEENKVSGNEAPPLTEEQKREIADKVGFGAVKFADLSGNRNSDYRFDLEKMLATTGHTATYMQYAYARCRSIIRKGNADEKTFRTSPPAVLMTFPAERALALQLLKFGDVLAEAETKYEPHHVAAYLFEVATAFSAVYEAGNQDNSKKVIHESNPPEVQASRLLLTDLTGRMIKQALVLLGIYTVEQM